MSEQIRPWDTLACCWDVKQPTNNIMSLDVWLDKDIYKTGDPYSQVVAIFHGCEISNSPELYILTFEVLATSDSQTQKSHKKRWTPEIKLGMQKKQKRKIILRYAFYEWNLYI